MTTISSHWKKNKHLPHAPICHRTFQIIFEKVILRDQFSGAISLNETGGRYILTTLLSIDQISDVMSLVLLAGKYQSQHFFLEHSDLLHKQ